MQFWKILELRNFAVYYFNLQSKSRKLLWESCLRILNQLTPTLALSLSLSISLIPDDTNFK